MLEFHFDESVIFNLGKNHGISLPIQHGTEFDQLWHRMAHTVIDLETGKFLKRRHSSKQCMVCSESLINDQFGVFCPNEDCCWTEEFEKKIYRQLAGYTGHGDKNER